MGICSKWIWRSLPVARWVCYAAVAVSVGRAAPFQQQTQSVPEAQAPIFRAEHNEVEVVVMARDSKGQPVNGLTQSDFEIRDNGKLQTISSFAVQGGTRHARHRSTHRPVAWWQSGPDGSAAIYCIILRRFAHRTRRLRARPESRRPIRREKTWQATTA